jgi:hypothetical protein
MTKVSCQNCTWTGDYDDAAPARDVHMRHEPGDEYSDIECPDCGALCYEEEEKNAAGFWSVSVFLIDQAYGGPEEGGWYYTCGQESSDPEHAILHRRFLKVEEARDYAADLNAKHGAAWNEGRPSMYSVLSDGIFHAMAHPGHVTHFPAVVPHYE